MENTSKNHRQTSQQKPLTKERLGKRTGVHWNELVWGREVYLLNECSLWPFYLIGFYFSTEISYFFINCGFFFTRRSTVLTAALDALPLIPASARLGRLRPALVPPATLATVLAKSQTQVSRLQPTPTHAPQEGGAGPAHGEQETPVAASGGT